MLSCWFAAGNVVVSGGLGVLGSLVAAWLSSQMSSPHAPHLTLLGRSGRVADSHILNILADSQSQVRFLHIAFMLHNEDTCSHPISVAIPFLKARAGRVLSDG